MIKRLFSFRPVNPALVISSLAMLASIASLLVSIQQTNMARRQQAASVWPYLQMDYQSSAAPGKKQLDVLIQNKGVGPARVKSIRLRHEGKDYDDFYRLFQSKYPEAKFSHFMNSLSGAVLSAGEIKTLITINDTLAAPAMHKILDETEIRVVYASVYDDLWMMTADTVYAIRNLKAIR